VLQRRANSEHAAAGCSSSKHLQQLIEDMVNFPELAAAVVWRASIAAAAAAAAAEIATTDALLFAFVCVRTLTFACSATLRK
jgi:hypothetical protein